MRLINVLLATVCLAACGEPASRTGAANGASGPEAPEVRNLTAVPANFQGVWAATEDDCAAPSETRLEITAGRMRFYESSGEVGSVEARGGDEVLIVIPLTGEGTRSQRSFRYRLLDGGQRLFDVRNGLTRIRCPSA